MEKILDGEAEFFRGLNDVAGNELMGEEMRVHDGGEQNDLGIETMVLDTGQDSPALRRFHGVTDDDHLYRLAFADLEKASDGAGGGDREAQVFEKLFPGTLQLADISDEKNMRELHIFQFGAQDCQ